jgi:hypothetical protein
VLRAQNGGAVLTMAPYWDTVQAPDFRYLDANHNRWRDRGLFLIRSPHGLGRLVLAMKVPVRIVDPGCVAKTFPDYFSRLGGLLQPRQAWEAMA